VRLQRANGTVLPGRDLRSLAFEGSATLPPLPLRWTLVSNDPDRLGNSVLFSGNDSNTDASAVASVTVPTTDPTLRFVAKYGAEQGFDYGYVIVSTDGGATYTSIAGDKTVPGPLGPGVNGTTNGFEQHTYDLSAYAGMTVLLHQRRQRQRGRLAGRRHDGRRDAGQRRVQPCAVRLDHRDQAGRGEQLERPLIGYDEQHAIALQAEFNGKSSIRLGRLQLLAFSLFPTVVAEVAYDGPTELVGQYAPYTLTVNGVAQPGGGGGT
jgi:Immune inhibitor A-like, MAM domain